uniref:Uncharacterized protein n=1 Tax=Sinorhizobium arboris TaxID=76745 RepID=D1CSI8_9HYPH|nr:hypothetical protein [Sinorhizobium arboris LMG 14919]
MNVQVAVKMNSGPSIMLASGTWFDLLDPWHSHFTIQDIAQGPFKHMSLRRSV